MAVGVIARLKVKEGMNEEFEGIFKELQAAVAENEPENNFYAIHRSASDPQTYVVLEQYANQAALDAHGRTDHFTTIGAKMGGCMAGRAEIERMEAV